MNSRLVIFFSFRSRAFFSASICFFAFFFSGLTSFDPPADFPFGFTVGALPSSLTVTFFIAGGLDGPACARGGAEVPEINVTSTGAPNFDSLLLFNGLDERDRADTWTSIGLVEMEPRLDGPPRLWPTTKSML